MKNENSRGPKAQILSQQIQCWAQIPTFLTCIPDDSNTLNDLQENTFNLILKAQERFWEKVVEK